VILNASGCLDALEAPEVARGLDAFVTGTDGRWRVRIGRYATYREAAAALDRMRANGLTGFVAEEEGR
jgi:cell division protein FtsN